MVYGSKVKSPVDYSIPNCFCNGNKGSKITAQEKLVRFMEGKANKLKEIGIPPSMYFNNKDKKYLLDLEDNLATKVWGEMIRYIQIGASGLYLDTCPFCIIFQPRCEECPYGKNHGICGSDNSDFRKITNKIGRNVLRRLLSEEFYRDLMSRIECGNEGSCG